MMPRGKTVLIVCCLVALFGWQGREADAQTICYRCHDRAAFRGKVVHEPVAKGNCDSCHNPHVARYKGLLQTRVRELCYSCHQRQQHRFSQGVMHQPVLQGNCLACHDPHASALAGLIKGKNLAQNCFSCHKELNRSYQVSHKPFAQGRCTSCHQSHQAKEPLLLIAPPAKLCRSCHPAAKLARGHQGFPGKIDDCLSCHNPHGSQRKALIRNVLHQPYQKGCATCHAKGKDLKTAASCLACHEQIRSQLFTTHSHLTAASGNSCVACHTPHAGDNKSLLKGSESQTCRRCHADTVASHEQAKHPHPDTKKCSNCHAVHGSSHLAMLKGDGIAVCATCHETQGKFTHPVGNKVRDPRNGQPVDCVTCHYPHGTPYKAELKLSGDKALCVQCHRSY